MAAWLQNLKVPFFTIFFIFFFLYVYTKLAGPLPFSINSIQTTKQDVFQAQGTGEASAVPDTATISFAVTKQASTIQDAQNQTNTTSTAILNSLKALGIDSKNIKTINYDVQPNYVQNQTITGYSVTQNMEVKMQTLNKVNTAIDALTKNGANVIGQVSFGFSNSLQQKLENQARQEAVDKAKQKAESLAHAAGIHLGQVINVTENPANTPQPLPMLQAAKTTGEGSVPSQVTPGENSISTTVTLSYQTY